MDSEFRYTQAEIFAAAMLLKMEIYAFSWQEANQRYQWLCYKPITLYWYVSHCRTETLEASATTM